jgi:16S rRNA (uracil1498-N3)-methyltransferase
MAHEFFFFASPLEGEIWRIDEEDAHQIRTVLRLKAGDLVGLLDGHGTSGHGVLTSVTKQEILVQTTEMRKVERPAHTTAIILPVFRHRSIEDILWPVNELGLSKLIVYPQPRSPKDVLTTKTLPRWQKLLRESTKQCRRPYFLDIAIEESLESVAKHLVPLSNRLLLDPEGQAPFSASLKPNSASYAVIGSEKGLMREELEFFRAQQFSSHWLGHNILRSTTAVIAAAAFLMEV